MRRLALEFLRATAQAQVCCSASPSGAWSALSLTFPHPCKGIPTRGILKDRRDSWSKAPSSQKEVPGPRTQAALRPVSGR